MPAFRQKVKTIFGRQFGFSFDGLLVLNPEKISGFPQNTLVKCQGLAQVRVTAAQVLALNATPQPIIAAPGAGLAIVVDRVAVYKPAGTAYAGIAVGEDLVLKYTNGSGAQVSSVIETTGFLDQTTAQTRTAGPPGAVTATAADYAPVANAAVVLHLLTGEISTGDSDLIVWAWYDVIPTVLYI